MEGIKPTRAQLLASAGKTIKDLVAPGLSILFVGINPGLYTAWSGNHFAKPGNRFWPALHASGLTPRLLHPSEEQALLTLGIGITGFVRRATATAAELTDDEYRAGAKRIRSLVKRIRPHCVCFLGLTAYRAGFDQPKAQLGPQADDLYGSKVWLLPNPSGLNAHFQPADYARLFREVRLACMTPRVSPPGSTRGSIAARRA
ncbi:MAG TPA: G/U mismatch-specific DNA glycosylase [Gemmatimonadaceae bacterium]|nr:G/U mismatch-specific DNA glycosylase [Gemmatimonadaceae bacterium]